jgi:serine/threonine-protein kinase
VRPFAGRSAAEIIAHVLHDEPAPLAGRRPHLPAELHRIVRKCLQKEPARRYQRAEDLALDLRDLAAQPAAPREAAPGQSQGSRGSRVVWPVALAVVAGAAVWGWMRPTPEALDQPPSRLAVPVPSFGGASTALQRQIAITPDGTTVLFVGLHESRNLTMRLDLDKGEAAPVPGVREYIADYAISPDGREFIGTIIGSQSMVRYSLEGGAARPLPADLPASPNVAWEQDGTIWSSLWKNASFRLRGGGPVERVAHVRNLFQLGQILPGGQTGLGVKVTSGNFGRAVLVDLASGAETQLLDADVVEVRYSAGYLVYAQPDGTLQAVAFDPGARRVTGGAVRIADNVTLTGNGLAQFAVAENGTVVYVPEAQRSLVLVERNGASRDATPERRNFHAPMFSPDGLRIATDFTSADGRDVWVLDLKGGVLSRATFDRDGHDAVWMPDGQSLNYLATQDGKQSVFRTKAGTGRELLFSFAENNYTGLWLDPRTLVTVTIQTASPETGAYDLSLVRLTGSTPTVEPLLATRYTEERPALSRDGKWLAFTSTQSGRDEVYVRPVAGGDPVQVSVAGGVEPLWGPEGNELFYRSAEAKSTPMLIRAAVTTTPAFSVASRQALFSVMDVATATPHRNYDISPDGRTFAMVRYNPATRIMVIQNLPALVRKLGGAAAPAR